MADLETPDEATSDRSGSPLSLSRLTAAFARMLGGGGDDAPAEQAAPAASADAITPEGIIEAMLFVGRSDDTPLTGEEMAAVIRDVSPAEIEAIVDRLNAGYEQDGAARRIERSAAGYRMTLAAEFDRLRDRLADRAKPTKLSPAATEVLSIVAYRQPIASDEVDAMRGKRSNVALAQLVRRGLLCRTEQAEDNGAARYTTTDRFLRLFSLGTLDQLPRVTELED